MSPTRTASSPIPPAQTALLLLVPMVLVPLILRLYLHFVEVRHVYPAGYLVHHLFTGTVLLIGASFVLAFGTRFRWLALVVRIVAGTGAGLILDELAFLILTGASDADYVSTVSLRGSVICLAGGTILGLALYGWHERKRISG